MCASRLCAMLPTVRRRNPHGFKPQRWNRDGRQGDTLDTGEAWAWLLAPTGREQGEDHLRHATRRREPGPQIRQQPDRDAGIGGDRWQQQRVGCHGRRAQLNNTRARRAGWARRGKHLYQHRIQQMPISRVAGVLANRRCGRKEDIEPVNKARLRPVAQGRRWRRKPTGPMAVNVNGCGRGQENRSSPINDDGRHSGAGR